MTEELPAPVGGIAWRRGAPGDDAVLHALASRLAEVDDPAHRPAPSDTALLLGQVHVEDALLLGMAGGVPMAYALRFRPGGSPVRMLGGVAPEFRGRGIGRALLRWQLADAARAEPDAPLRTVRAVGGAGVTRLAERFGFSREREFLTMRRSLGEPLPQGPIPPGLRSVPLTPDLDETVRVAKNDAFRDHWQSSVESPVQWRARSVGPRLDRDRSRVAVDGDGAVAGFVLAWSAPERADEVYVPLVGTVRAWRGHGIARALLAEVLRAGAASGRTTAALDVDGANPTGATRVYAALGFEIVSAATVWGRRA